MLYSLYTLTVIKKVFEVDQQEYKKSRGRIKFLAIFYNWQCPHGSLTSKTPFQIVTELGEKITQSDEIRGSYKLKNEHIQIANYQTDLTVRKLKGFL